MSSVGLDEIWAILDEQKQINESEITIEKERDNFNCKNCCEILYDNTCRECGLVSDFIEYSNYVYEEPLEPKKKYNTNYSNKIVKMLEWSKWTNNEINQYKLDKYTRELCEKLEINDSIINGVIYLVSQVMSAIKSSYYGPKRSRVKDGIIIVCIYYISKTEFIDNYSYITLAKKLNLDIKYASRADKLIMELINANKLNISQEFVNSFIKTETPMSYVIKIVERYNFNFSEDLLQQVNNLIDICDDNDILIDHTPLSIGVSCFYYILLLNKIDIDLKIFSEIYNLSIVTIFKTYHKLQVYTERFEKFGIKPL